MFLRWGRVARRVVTKQGTAQPRCIHLCTTSQFQTRPVHAHPCATSVPVSAAIVPAQRCHSSQYRTYSTDAASQTAPHAVPLQQHQQQQQQQQASSRQQQQQQQQQQQPAAHLIAEATTNPDKVRERLAQAAQVADTETCHLLFDALVEAGHTPTVTEHNAVICAYAHAAKPKAVHRLIARLRRSSDASPDAETYRLLFKSLAGGRGTQGIEAAWALMEEDGV